MHWEPIRRCGYLRIERFSLPSGKGKRRIAALLHNVVRSFAEKSVDYWQYDPPTRRYDLPFIYSEKQVITALLPALQESSARVLVELPVDRGARLQERTHKTTAEPLSGGYGWADYWVDRDRSLSVILEIKHAWISAQSKRIQERAVAKWQTCQEQLSNIARVDLTKYVSAGHPTWMVGMLIGVHWDGASPPDDHPRDESWETHKSIREQLTERSGEAPWPINWTALWYLHYRIGVRGDTDLEPMRYYPAVSFYASAYRINT